MPFTSDAGRWLLRRLTGASLISDVDAGFTALADDVDALLTPFSSGPGADRPVSTAASPGKAGRTYFATDWGIEYVDLGTGWAVRGGYTGKVSMNLLNEVPDGHLAMNGQAVTSAYPRLRSRLIAQGVPVNGAGDPVLPNMADRVPVGAGGALAALRALTGASSNSVAFTIPDHTHTPGSYAAPDHLHEAGTLYAASPGHRASPANNLAGGTQEALAYSNHQHDVAGFTAAADRSLAVTGSSGGASARNGTISSVPTVQPSIGVNFVIQT